MCLNDLFVIESCVLFGALSDRVFNFSLRANVVVFYDVGCVVVEVFLRDDVYLFCDGCCGDWVIICDYVNFDVSVVVFCYGFRNVFARRVNEREEIDEGEVIDWEVWFWFLGKFEVIFEFREFFECEIEDVFIVIVEIFVRLRVGAFEFGIFVRRFIVGKV